MSVLRLSSLLMMCAIVTACSGGDAPAGPTVTATAQAADVAQPAPPVAAAPDNAPVAPAPEVTPATAPVPAPVAAAPPANGAAADYQVQCASAATAAEQCQVDKDTYIGWRTFASQCQVCHGGSALGSTFAPNLLDRFHQRVDHARFVEVVTNGFRGQVGAMPAWKGNPNVMPHVDQLYRYLKARADGVLPPGRPERLP